MVIGLLCRFYGDVIVLGIRGVLLGGQTVLGSWVVVAAVVFWSYTGALTSLLAVRRIPQPIQTLRDLLNDRSVTLIMPPKNLMTDMMSVS